MAKTRPRQNTGLSNTEDKLVLKVAPCQARSEIPVWRVPAKAAKRRLRRQAARGVPKPLAFGTLREGSVSRITGPSAGRHADHRVRGDETRIFSRSPPRPPSTAIVRHRTESGRFATPRRGSAADGGRWVSIGGGKSGESRDVRTAAAGRSYPSPSVPS